MKGLFASALAMILNVYILYAFSLGPLSWVVQSPAGGTRISYTTDFIVGCTISLTQVRKYHKQMLLLTLLLINESLTNISTTITTILSMYFK